VIHRLELSFALTLSVRSHFRRAPSRAASSEQRIVWTGIDSTRARRHGDAVRQRRLSRGSTRIATEEW